MSLTPQHYQQPAMTLVGLKTRFYGSDSEKNNIGSQLPPLWNEFLERLEEVPNAIRGCCYGVVWPISVDSELLEYHAAIAVTHTDDLPRGMSAVTIPAAEYARFTHRGHSTLVDNTVNYIYSSWLLPSERQL